MEIIQKFIYLPQNMGPEFRVPLPMELSFAPLSDVAEPSPYVIAVYRYFNHPPYNEYVYKLDGVRIVGLPNNRVQPTGGTAPLKKDDPEK